MNKIIMIGMNPRTRDLIPWDADAEFWTMNEGPVKDWMKRWDVDFQIHRRWDWERNNNFSDVNHPLFLKAVNDTCLFCKGSAKAFKDGKQVTCPYCKDGIYKVPEYRFKDIQAKAIIMQNENADVPGCVLYPIERVKEMQLEGENMLTSTLAYMLAYAILNYRDCAIEIYGFEAESNTEYAVQRPGIVYWIGYGRGLGMNITAPGAKLLKNKYYAYEDFDQGYRSRLEIRRHQLRLQLNEAEVENCKAEGRVDALAPFRKNKRIKPIYEREYSEFLRKDKFVSFLRGTIKEYDTAIEILDAYRLDMDEANEQNIRRLIELKYQLG